MFESLWQALRDIVAFFMFFLLGGRGIYARPTGRV
jgi:hypothetical protein